MKKREKDVNEKAINRREKIQCNPFNNDFLRMMVTTNDTQIKKASKQVIVLIK